MSLDCRGLHDVAVASMALTSCYFLDASLGCSVRVMIEMKGDT